MATEQDVFTSPEVEGTVRFHGHFCPGIAIGIRAAQVALREIGPHSMDEEVVAIVETDMCAVDAVQYLTGCTFGKGNFFYLDYGKNAYTFIRRSDGKAIRILGRPGAFGSNPEREALMARIDSGKATPEDQQRFGEMQRERAWEILEAPEDELFDVQLVSPVIPGHARLRASAQCDVCGETMMETRSRHIGGQLVCIPCFEKLEAR